MKTSFRITAIALATAAVSLSANAQSFPAAGKNITIVVPFAAGGPTDRVARDLAEAMRKPLNATLVIENLGGAGSSIGTAKVANANPDGYTLLVNHIGMSTMPSLYRKLSFDVLKDFEFLGIVNDVPMTVIGRPNLPANNFAELRD
ncbi:MAG: tripartite tricarboxylate transporter substrate-binding protein, partial [Comamonadaceae bacterium]|nr:tripartite tricarboxylate transporter substrate-binding protein [Comamonadaceae bacterium]